STVVAELPSPTDVPIYEDYGPPSLYPLIQDGALAGEGLWTSDGFPLPPDGGSPAFWKTYLRPDPARPDALTYLVRFDLHRVRVHLVAGTQEPESPTGVHGTGIVASGDLGSLVAAFNGGWKTITGAYGMMVHGQQIAPANPRADTATLAIHANGRVELASWQ